MVVFAALCSKGESETSTFGMHNSSNTSALGTTPKGPFSVSRGCRPELAQPIRFDFSKILSSAYGVSLNLNSGQ
jgi:hypothetical protein